MDLDVGISWPQLGDGPTNATIDKDSAQNLEYGFKVLEWGQNASGQKIASLVQMGFYFAAGYGGSSGLERYFLLPYTYFSSTDGVNYTLANPYGGTVNLVSFGFRYVTSTDSPTCAYQYGATPRAFMSSASLKLDPLAETITLSTGASTSGPVEGSDWIVIPNSDPLQYYCANTRTTGLLSSSLRIVMQVPFLEDGPQPTATPTPFSTPTPQITPTPSPIPTLLPPDKDLNCPPQISNEVDRLMRELERLQASIPGAPPLAGGTQGFSVKAAPLAYPVAMGLVYLGTNYPRVHNFVQGALRATLSSLATKTSELDQARAKKAAKDAEFAEAVKNGDSASFQRLRKESNDLQKDILGLEAEQRQLEQAKHNHEQNLQKLDQLGQNVAGVQASAQDNCNTPNPSPSPSNNPSPSPTAPNWIPEAAIQKIPKEWGAGIPTRKGEGWRWTDPTNKGNIVRIDKGNPLNSQPTQQVDHVIINADGRILGKDGMPINGSIKSDPINTHIPLNDWINWTRWNKL